MQHNKPQRHPETPNFSPKSTGNTCHKKNSNGIVQGRGATSTRADKHNYAEILKHTYPLDSTTEGGSTTTRGIYRNTCKVVHTERGNTERGSTQRRAAPAVQGGPQSFARAVVPTERKPCTPTRTPTATTIRAI